MALLSRYAADKAKEENGVWLPFGDPSDPIEFKIARFERALAAEVERLPWEERQLAREGRLPISRQLELAMEATSSRVILDWRNVQEVGPDGQFVEVPYSPERALAILKDERYGELHEWILEQSRSRSNFRETFLEASRKN